MSRRELALQKRVVRAIVRMGGEARIRTQTPYTIVGDPDVYGTLLGHHFEIEVKVDPMETATVKQMRQLAKWKRAGAIVGIVRSVEEAVNLLTYATEGRKR